MCVFLSVCLHFSRIFLLYSPQPPQHAWDTPIIITSSVGAMREMQKIIISNLQLPCVQPPTSSYNFQLPRRHHGHHGRVGHVGHVWSWWTWWSLTTGQDTTGQNHHLNLTFKVTLVTGNFRNSCDFFCAVCSLFLPFWYPFHAGKQSRRQHQVFGSLKFKV